MLRVSGKIVSNFWRKTPLITSNIHLLVLHTQHATRNKHRKNQNYLVYFKVAPRQPISAAVLPKVRYRAYPFGLASFALIAISQLRLGILTEEGEGSKKQPH